jgi:SNF2 family DNA or RNA helicase
VERQASARAHRIGQTRPVLVYRLVAAGSIEERLLALQQRKSALAEAVLGPDAGTTAQLALADVRALLAPLSDGNGE